MAEAIPQNGTASAKPTVSTVQTSSFQGVERKAVSLSFLPKIEILRPAAPYNPVTLLTDEGTDFTRAVQTQLEAEGHRVVLISFLPTQNTLAKYRVDSSLPVDAAIKKTVDSVLADYGTIHHFIHLHPHFEFTGFNFAQHFATEKGIIKNVFLFAKHLQAVLNTPNPTFRNSFMTVSRLDGRLGLGGRSNISVVGGGLMGLVKSLNLEWSSVFCRAIDIQPELPNAVSAAAIANELYDANLHYTQIGIAEEGRTTFSTSITPLNDTETITAQVTENDVFLVSGGGRGVTASCIIEMAKKFQNKFILIGRSSIDAPLPTYAVGVTSEPDLKALIMNDLKSRGEKVDLNTVKRVYNTIIAKQEIEDTLHAIQTAGGDAVYLAGDVNDLRGIKNDIKTVTDKWGKITGLIHGAGRLADKLIQHKTEDDFENVISVKLQGLLSMLQAVNVNDLRHVVLFSSVAGFYGNVGQTDYAIANEILSKAAYLFRRNHPHTKVSAINWGAWEGGMVSPELKKKFLAAGVVLVNHAGGAAMFVNEFNTAYDNQPQVIIGGTLPTPESTVSDDLKTYTVQKTISINDNPFLLHHRIQGKPVLPAVNAAAWMADTCANLYPDFTLYQIEDLRLFKGIVFENDAPKTYTTTAQEIQKTNTAIVFEVTVSSNGAKLPLLHYKAIVRLRLRKAALEIPRFEMQPSHQIPTNILAADLYKDGTLFHDKFFQGIEQVISISDNHILLQCKAPAVPTSLQGQFPVQSLNPFFLDIQYQGMLVWVAQFHHRAKSLPLHTALGTVYKAMPFDSTLFVHLQITENTPTKMVATCTVYDEAGDIYAQTEGAAVTIAPNLVW